MKIISETIKLGTKGNPDLINITDKVRDILIESKLKKGIMTVFVVGSTAAITTFEFEPGIVKDVRDFYEKLIPSNKHYAHDETWGDPECSGFSGDSSGCRSSATTNRSIRHANGFSHLRAALQRPSLTIPIDGGKLLLGTWQQVVLTEFDNRPRDREIVVQIIGE